MHLKVLQILLLLKFSILLTLKYKLETTSGIKTKLIDLLSELRGFKFVTTLVSLFKKIKLR